MQGIKTRFLNIYFDINDHESIVKDILLAIKIYSLLNPIKLTVIYNHKNR